MAARLDPTMEAVYQQTAWCFVARTAIEELSARELNKSPKGPPWWLKLLALVLSCLAALFALFSRLLAKENVRNGLSSAAAACAFVVALIAILLWCLTKSLQHQEESERKSVELAHSAAYNVGDDLKKIVALLVQDVPNGIREESDARTALEGCAETEKLERQKMVVVTRDNAYVKKEKLKKALCNATNLVNRNLGTMLYGKGMRHTNQGEALPLLREALKNKPFREIIAVAEAEFNRSLPITRSEVVRTRDLQYFTNMN